MPNYIIKKLILKKPGKIFPQLIIITFLFGCFSAKRAPIQNVKKTDSDSSRIAIPANAPKPLSPQEALKLFKIAEGFKIELVASEPLIQEPTQVCWDEKGRMYVSELHGYNLEGQLEVEDLNKTGKLDTIVQRVQAAPRYKKAAETGTYGTIKRLTDTNGDGLMDKVEVLADQLPPAYGLCAAGGGIIVAGQAEIIYIADKDNDGKAEVIESLFKGFQSGALERGINAPQWGPDGWIYFGRGWNGGRITGAHLKEPVDLPGSNFRIRADGSAIEPVTGSTHTIGHAFTADGESFFTNTWKHALYAIPIQWKYLSRNPNASISSLEADASDFSTVFPAAAVHPWKLARSNQEGWRKLYDQYGIAESAAEGYFTSCCSPLIYQDNTFPAEFSGNLFVCEPAQCLIHRSIVEHEGPSLKVRRASAEQKSEFLVSTDSWFRPVSIVHAPDGSLYITDMYREIIEDYSAVPRFMQQQYGVNHGIDKGRIWRVSATSAKSLAQTEKVDLTKANLEEELESPHYWHRQTAERLLWEQQGPNASALIKRRISITNLSAATATLDFINTLRREDTVLKSDVIIARRLGKLSSTINDERMLLQLALSLGYSEDKEVFDALVNLAKKHANIRWMPDAIMTGVNNRAVTMLSALLKDPGRNSNMLLEPLAASISAGQDSREISSALIAIANAKTSVAQANALKGLSQDLKNISLSVEAKSALNKMIRAKDLAVQGQAVALAGKLNLGDSKALDSIRKKAAADARDAKLETQQRLAAIALLADSPDEFAANSLIAAWPTANLTVKLSILDALISKGTRLNQLVEAISNKMISVNALTELQRTRLLERADSHLRPRVEAELDKAVDQDKEAIYAKYAQALGGEHDPKKGETVFKQMCSTCHRVNNIGVSVGPDLKLAYKNSKETLLRSILFPNEKISSSYEIYVVTTTNNETYTGVLVNESAGSVVIRQPGGMDKNFLRKDIKKLESSPTSLMPEYGEAISPDDCANIIEWLKTSLAIK